jgi:hypothetical protein
VFLYRYVYAEEVLAAFAGAQVQRPLPLTHPPTRPATAGLELSAYGGNSGSAADLDDGCTDRWCRHDAPVGRTALRLRQSDGAPSRLTWVEITICMPQLSRHNTF